MLGSQQDSDDEAGFRGTLLDTLVGYHLRQASNLFFSDFAEHVSPLGLRQTQTGILILCRDRPGLSPSELSDHLGLQRTNVTKALGEFEEAGLIVRRGDVNDRRRIGVWLTDKGEAAVQRSVEAVLAREEKLLGQFSNVERTILLDLLRRLHIGNEAQ